MGNTYRTFRLPNVGNVGKNTISLSCKYLQGVKKLIVWLKGHNPEKSFSWKGQEKVSKVFDSTAEAKRIDFFTTRASVGKP